MSSVVSPGIYRILSVKGVTSYRVRVRIKGHKPLSKTFKSLAHAKKWRRVTEGLIEKGESLNFVKQSNKTFIEAAEKYEESLTDYRKMQVKPHLDRWKKEIGYLRLSKITPAHIAAVRDELLKEMTSRKKKRSPATVVRYLATHISQTAVAISPFSAVCYRLG